MGKYKRKELNSTQKIGEGLKLVKQGKLQGFKDVSPKDDIIDVSGNVIGAGMKKKQKLSKDQVLENRFQDIIKELDEAYADTTTKIKDLTEETKYRDESLEQLITNCYDQQNKKISDLWTAVTCMGLLSILAYAVLIAYISIFIVG